MAKRYMAFAVALAMLAGVQFSASAQWTWTRQSGRWVDLKRLPKETPELQVEYARTLLMEGNYKRAIRETEKFESYYNDSEFADDNQFIRGEVRMAQGKYMEAAKEFQKLVGGYPESDLFDQVIKKQYEVGDLYYEKGVAGQKASWWHLFRNRPFRKAIDVYGMVIENQPFTDSAAEAQYKIGLCYFTLKDYTEAAYEYKKTVEEYGSSEWVDDASYGLAECYYTGSHPSEYDQMPSYLAIKAMDEFQTKFPGDSRAADFDTKRTEMRERIARQRLMTAKFYEKRRRFDAARIYYGVICQEFSGTTAAGEAQSWLDANVAGTSATATQVEMAPDTALEPQPVS